MRYPCVRVVRAEVGWAVYACPDEGSSLFVAAALKSDEALRVAFGWLFARGLDGWAVELDGREVKLPEQLEMGFDG